MGLRGGVGELVTGSPIQPSYTPAHDVREGQTDLYQAFNAPNQKYLTTGIGTLPALGNSSSRGPVNATSSRVLR